MADSAKISALPASTDAQMTDAGLIETAVADSSSSTGFTSKKSTLARLATYILNKFTGLSLAGSSQTVKSAIDSLNSNTYSLLIGTAITSGADLNAYTTAGNFYSASGTITNSLSNAPFSGYGFKMHVEYINSNGTILQTIASGHTPSQHYERRGQRASGSWTFSDWKEQPTRAEIDSLNSNTVNTTFASSDTSKYTLKNVRFTRRGSVYILLGEVKCVSPATSGEINIVSGNMAPVFSGQIFVPAWGNNNASKDALGVHFSVGGIYLSYGTAGSFYELVIPMFA